MGSPPSAAPTEDTATVKPHERLVTVLMTLSVPDTDADADDAATLIAVAADSTAPTVIHTTGVEGHLPHRAHPERTGPPHRRPPH
jgi:hypothetical protein